MHLINPLFCDLINPCAMVNSCIHGKVSGPLITDKITPDIIENALPTPKKKARRDLEQEREKDNVG